MKITAKKIASQMQRRGHKLTPQRRAIIDAIADSHDHLTPAEIHEKVRREHKDIGLVTVYRTIELLARMGLICEVHPGGASRNYLLRRPSEHHHHLVCSGCGTVVDFTSCDLNDLEHRLCSETGFDISGHLLEFSGRCRTCQAITP
ncbi:Fur family transcriptional regulator [Chloroflexota bacterium]